jgi:hypothetical protein
MKRLLGILFAIILVFALAVPVMASTDVGTTVTIGGGGDTPVVKCKWEQEPDNNITLDYGATYLTGILNHLESGDTLHTQYPAAVPSYSQFNPPMIKNAQKLIEYFAVVPTLNVGSIQAVFALVFHPLNSPAPYNSSVVTVPDPGPRTAAGETIGLFKYKVEYSLVGNSQPGNANYNATVASTVQTASDAHLIKFGTSYNITDVLHQLSQGEANLWRGTALIDYEQPAGDYTVDVYAINTGGVFSEVLSNYFNYVPTAGVEVDFNAVNYGNIQLGQEAKIGGDTTWNTPVATAPSPNPATVRNIGNTWAHVTLSQTDMSFGYIGSGTPAFDSRIGTGSVAPTAFARGDTRWNVFYDAVMGNSLFYKVYFTPGGTVRLPNYLLLSTQDKLDLSIFVFQGSGTHSGTLTIGAEIEQFH